jgi:hypothetical protein
MEMEVYSSVLLRAGNFSCTFMQASASGEGNGGRTGPHLFCKNVMYVETSE